MTIQCPECSARYRIDPARARKTVVKVKCPQCAVVFEVTLQGSPQSTSLEEAASAANAEAGAPNSSSSAVLIVDDSSFFRELVVDVLKPLHLDFIMAADGLEALRLIREQHPALVILDLNLPGMSGNELIRAVRKDPSLSRMRLLAMSGVYRKETDAAEVQAAGADDFISKSFKPEQLQLRVQKLLATRA